MFNILFKVLAFVSTFCVGMLPSVIYSAKAEINNFPKIVIKKQIVIPEANAVSPNDLYIGSVATMQSNSEGYIVPFAMYCDKTKKKCVLYPRAGVLKKPIAAAQLRVVRDNKSNFHVYPNKQAWELYDKTKLPQYPASYFRTKVH